MSKKYLQPVSIIAMTFLVLTSFALVFQAQDAFALVVVGEDAGLRVRLSDVPTPTDNLNPGDTKTSVMTISNIGSFSLPVTLSGRITRSALGLGGGDLDQKLTVTVLDPTDKVVYTGSMSGMNKPITLEGNLNPGESRPLRFVVHFPPETPNAYQAASITVQWTVVAQGPTPYNPPPYYPPYTPPVQPPVEPPVQPPVVPPVNPPTNPPGEEIVIPPVEEVPIGPAVLPKTGETNPAIFYGLGVALVGLGLVLSRRGKAAKH